MSNLQGNFALNGNLAIKTDKPIDDRSVALRLTDLYSLERWDNFQYVGMTVYVVNDEVVENNGLYLFIGPNKADVIKPESWYRLDGQSITWIEGDSV